MKFPNFHYLHIFIWNRIIRYVENEEICYDLLGNAFIFRENNEGAFILSSGSFSGRRNRIQK